MDTRASGIRCEGCGGTDFDSGEDGFYYCQDCGGQSQDVLETACADEDVFGDGGGAGTLYSAKHVRHSQSRSQSQLLSQFQPQSHNKASKEEIIRSLARNLGSHVVEERTDGFDNEVYQPMDFGSVQHLDEKAVADAIRLRYVQGMQLMIQMQCKELVESFKVSPLICGLVGVMWLRYLAVIRMFDEDWADKAIQEAEVAAHDRSLGKEQRSLLKRRKSESHSFSRRKPIYIWASSLRKMIPIHSSLAITFLACHVAREPILPTDLAKWALDGKLPYISAFVEIDKSLKNPSVACPLSSRFLFRPICSIGTWQLEATAGSIAKCIGLHLPPVNFYAIVQRYLKQLPLPLEKTLSHACYIYEWSMPAELWLSANPFKLPTRVCVMSILVVAIRFLYGINGNGIWEKSLSYLHCSFASSQTLDSGVSTSSQDSWKGDNHKEESLNACFHDSGIHPASEDSINPQTCDCDTVRLLHNLEAKYEEMIDGLDHMKDFRSYLKYCKDIVFTGMSTSYEEDSLIERLWDIYDKQEDNIANEIGFRDQSIKRLGDEVGAAMRRLSQHGDDNRRISDIEARIDECLGDLDSKGTGHSNRCPDANLQTCESKSERLSDAPTEERIGGKSSVIDTAKSVAVERMKLNMMEKGFKYLPPRIRHRSTDYLHYRRKKIGGKLHFMAHADYYILLRACAKLAQVDVRIMHLGVLKLERRLSWLEKRISDSLMLFRDELGRT